MNEPPEIVKTMRRLHGTLATTQKAIMDQARSLIPVLKDAGREHSARELERLFFEFDAALDESSDLITNSFKDILKLLTETRE